MDYEEILCPVDMYRDRLKAEHEKNSAEAFEELVKRSGVDEAANAALVAAIRKLEKEISALGAGLLRWRIFRWLMILVVLIGATAGVLYLVPRFGGEDFGVTPRAGAGGGAAAVFALALIFFLCNGRIRKFKSRVDEKKSALDAKMREAWAMMEPLNRLYRWDTVADIVMKTLPIMAVDKFCSEERLRQLAEHFQWNADTGDNCSALCCQSGAVNGNPWVAVEVLRQRWGMKTYTGSLPISWEEKEYYTDSNGRQQSRWVTRHQVLVATVEKPIPEYDKGKLLIYGNEAAPKLNFSREPNSLAEAGGGLFARQKLKSAIAALEKKSRDLSNSFTIMDNREFDACFSATDRSDEQQFRLLFTPLAQQEMLKLLRDKEQGYGDDFKFVKSGMINVLSSGHLDGMDISGAPGLFKSYDLAGARKEFNRYCNEFFRCFYFSFAPLFAIPLYQQHRNYLDIYQKIIDRGSASFMEHESFANAIGEERFRPAGAATRSILKTRVLERDGDAASLAVAAYAFRGEERLEYVSKLGGDGKWHNVPVRWTEYLPVFRESHMGICSAGTNDHLEFAETLKKPEWKSLLSSLDADEAALLFRRGLAAFPRRS